ncbi:hypothetical protein VTP01DRAFT_6721 [Rhizomucor pusillus]|uniref:uncharacterized protein n=1 Tax=Rhizomucor pusillus TaxID=4840 RepID=UPI003741ED9D
MTLDANYNFGSADEYTQLLAELHEDYCRAAPQDVLQFCANFFNRKLEEQRATFRQQQLGLFQDSGEQHPLSANSVNKGPEWFDPVTRPPNDKIIDNDNNPYSYSEGEEDEEYEDAYDDEERDVVADPMSVGVPPVTYNPGRRVSVSAESMTPSSGSEFIKKVIPKSPDQCERIRVSVANNFLFRNLDEEQYMDVVNAMEERRAVANEKVIEQGAIGDFFYVVESGTLDCFITQDNGETNKVANYEGGGSFGELALMYNAPRAATIIATSDCVLWALDRVTFRTILMENMSRKRRMYESFLREVPLLKSLEPSERNKIADALESVYFEDGEKVIMEGDIGDRFYIIESGQAAVYKKADDGSEQLVNSLGRAAYFGELALLNDSPRVATVVAQGRLKCASLGKKAFTRLLGPVLDILKRNSELYHAIINQQ